MEWSGTGSNSSYYTLKLTAYEYSTSTPDNSSSVYAKLELITKSAYFVDWSMPWSVSINGNPYSGSISSCSKNSTQLLWEKYVPVVHDSDGSKTIYCSASAKTSSAYDYLPGSMSCSGYLELTKIPRGSAITSFPAFTIESGVEIGYTDYLPNHTVALKLSWGSADSIELSTTTIAGQHKFLIASGVIASHLSDIYATLGKTNKSLTFTALMSTSDFDNTSTATALGTLDATINAPVISTETIEEMALPGYGVTGSEVVRYVSSKKLTIPVSSVNGAELASITISNADQSQSPTISGTSASAIVTMTNLTSGVFNIACTDTRGIASTKQLSYTLDPYVYPTLTKVWIEREQPTNDYATLTGNGTFYNGLIGTTQNAITLDYKLNTSSSYVFFTEQTLTDSKWSTSHVIQNLNHEEAFTVILRVTDSFGKTAENQATLSAGVYAMWMGKRTVRVQNNLILAKDTVDASKPCVLINEGDTRLDGSLFLKGSILFEYGGSVRTITPEMLANIVFAMKGN